MNEKKNITMVKRDSTKNWEKATNYIPNVGTIIVMDNEDKTIQLKFGDGKSFLKDLPNLLENVSGGYEPEVNDSTLTF